MNKFSQIFFLFSIMSTAVFCMEGPHVEVIFRYDDGTIGLQQRTRLLIHGVKNSDIIKVLAISSETGENLSLCQKKKKDHSVVLKTLNEAKEPDNIRSIDATFYCKGDQSGGCKKKPPAIVKFLVTIFHDNGTKVDILSDEFKVIGNRRNKTKAPVLEDLKSTKPFNGSYNINERVELRANYFSEVPSTPGADLTGNIDEEKTDTAVDYHQHGSKECSNNKNSISFLLN